jgi:hypothetical protein
MGTKELIDKLNNANMDFQRFECWGEYAPRYLLYVTLELLPSLCFVVDSQMNDTFKWADDSIHESYVGIGLHFAWLTFNVGFQVNFKTNKPLSNV